MAKEVTAIPTALIKSITWAFNQGRTLELDESCLIENKHIGCGDAVSYNDVAMGEIFEGYAFQDTPKRAPDDESIALGASDLGRALQKQPAYLMCRDACPPLNNTNPAHADLVNFGSTKFHINAGVSIAEAIRLVMDIMGPHGLNIVKTGMLHIDKKYETEFLHQDLDKGGQSVAEWLDAISDQTEGGVWSTVGDELYFTDFYAQPPCPLHYSEFTDTKDPNPSNQIIVIQDNVGESCDSKYRGVTIEGQGIFDRKTLTDFSGPSCAPRAGEFVAQSGDKGVGTGVYVGGSNFVYNFRWYLPESVCTDIYLDVHGKFNTAVYFAWLAHYTQDGVAMRRTPDGVLGDTDPEESALVPTSIYLDTDPFAFDGPKSSGIAFKGAWDQTKTYGYQDVVKFGNYFWTSLMISNVGNPPGFGSVWWAQTNPDNPRFGKYYVAAGFILAAEPPARPTTPSFNLAITKVRYTSYEGPLVISKFSKDARLLREGEFPIQRPDYVKFTQSLLLDTLLSEVGGSSVHKMIEPQTTIDSTNDMKHVCDVQFRRKSNVPNRVGTIDVLMSKGCVGQLNIGMQILKYGPDCRIRSIKFDPANRVATLEVSSIPLREFIKSAKEQKAILSTNQKNWRARDPLGCSVQSLPVVILNQDCVPSDTYFTSCVEPPLAGGFTV